MFVLACRVCPSMVWVRTAPFGDFGRAPRRVDGMVRHTDISSRRVGDTSRRV